MAALPYSGSSGTVGSSAPGVALVPGPSGVALQFNTVLVGSAAPQAIEVIGGGIEATLEEPPAMTGVLEE
jgi:hypothetical protein